MDKKLYVIMGATGHIGHVISQELLRRKLRVRVIGRNPKKLELLKSLGAETVTLDNLEDANLLKEAFHRADAIFTMLPPDLQVEDYNRYQDAVGEATKIAIKKSKATHVINLSSIGAELTEGTGPIGGLHRQEIRLNDLTGVNVVHIRAGYFMENFFNNIDSIKQTGAFYSPIRADLPLQLVATGDIGKKAADLLDRLDFRGRTYFDFSGPRDVTMLEVTPLLANAIGKPDMKYIQVSYDDADKNLLSVGMKPSIVSLFHEMNMGFNDEKIKWTQRMTLDHRGKTTIEDFAKEFARAYQAKK